ncbi:MAG: hypothetical protein NW226_15530 [Microscillaceae bacterium]|nr:hypothetical protein [Microscillaceae bacterium]
MVELIAYTALIISLLSMSMRKIHLLRYLHIVSSSLYGIYGFFIASQPLMVGAGLFVMIHIYQLANTPQGRK